MEYIADMNASQQATERTPSALGHRERKKLRIKAQLTEAALTLFSEHGFERTTVEDITSAVDLVPRTFFRYFRSKDDALFSWFEVMAERMGAALLARPSGEGALSALIAVMREVLAVHHDAQERIVLITYRLGATSPDLHMRLSASRYDFQRQMARVLAERLGASAALVAEMVTAIAVAASIVAVDEWAAAGAKRPLRAYSEPIFARELKVFQATDERYVLREAGTS
jgi:AcrR family transcriptional regulator